MLLAYLMGVGVGVYLTHRVVQFLSVMAPGYVRPIGYAMAAGALFWPVLPAVAFICMLIGTVMALLRMTPK